MAHGSKKWIVRYDGRIKRSNDRTKKDYYGELKWWEPYGERRWRRKGEQKEHCPQCKHNYKPIRAHNNLYWKIHGEIRAEYDAGFDERVKEYNLQVRRYWKVGHALGENFPRDPHHWDNGWYDYQKSQEHRLPAKPIYDEEAWLCPKHRHMNDKKDEMWRGHPHGQNENYSWLRKAQYNYYRKEMDRKMAKNYEDYDDYEFDPYKPGWLD